VNSLPSIPDSYMPSVVYASALSLTHMSQPTNQLTTVCHAAIASADECTHELLLPTFQTKLISPRHEPRKQLRSLLQLRSQVGLSLSLSRLLRDLRADWHSRGDSCHARSRSGTQSAQASAHAIDSYSKHTDRPGQGSDAAQSRRQGAAGQGERLALGRCCWRRWRRSCHSDRCHGRGSRELYPAQDMSSPRIVSFVAVAAARDCGNLAMLTCSSIERSLVVWYHTRTSFKRSSRSRPS